MASDRPLALLGFLPPVLRGPILLALTRRLDLDPALLRGKRVLILGPAASLAEDLQGMDLSRYDLLVRFNNGLDTPMPLSGLDPLRCDLLFHSLTADARPVTPEKLRRAGVRWLVHRTPTKSALLQTLLAERRLHPCTVARIPVDAYRQLARELGGASPSSGLVCAITLLKMQVAELAIAGFTFFSTRYLAGYDNAVTSDEAARARIAGIGHHNPAQEAVLLARAFAAAARRGQVVTIGTNVERAIAAAAGGPAS